MSNNVLLVNFKVRSQADEAFSKLSKESLKNSFTINQMILAIKKEKGIDIEDIYDSGIDTTDDTLIGGLLGGVVGVFSGPIGLLLFGSLGAVIGSSLDATDASDNMSILKQVSDVLDRNEVAIIALIQERDEEDLNRVLEKYEAEIVRFDAAEIQYEVEMAKELEEEFKRVTKIKLKEVRKEERRDKVEKFKERIATEFEDFKDKFKE